MLITFNKYRNILINLNFKIQLFHLCLNNYIFKPASKLFSKIESLNIKLEQIHLKLRKLLNLINNQDQILARRNGKFHSTLNHPFILVIRHDMLIHTHDCVQGRS